MESDLRLLARFAATISMNDIPPDVIRAAAERILDNVSVGIAASDDTLIQEISNQYLELAGGKKAASIWGTGRKASVYTAVFLNALMCHRLESDDVHAKSKAHIGTVVIPAAWSLAESLGCSGKELLVAVIVGYEVEARIAMGFGVKEHRKLGWHVTATAGVFGAAAACGKLMRLEEDMMVSCLGLAGAQSFGTWAFLGDGSNSKVLNPARAAVNGCEAAVLASAGMRGPEHILEAEDGGLLHMMTSCAHTEYLSANLGSVWEICNVDNKVYPCCRSTHCAIDSVLAIRQQNPIDPDAIERIVISTYLIGKQQCATSKTSLNPRNDVDAKFSTPYCVAAALIAGKISLNEFDSDIMETPAIRELMTKVVVVADDRFTDAYPNHWGCNTAILFRDGSCCEMEVLDASGSAANPLPRDRLMSKAINMLARIYPQTAADLAEKLINVQKLHTLSEVFL